MNNLNDIGQRIKRLREEKKMSQAELAQLLNCPQSTVGEWERLKNRVPHRKYLSKLSKVLCVSIDYLLGSNSHIEDISYLGKIQSNKFNWPTKTRKTKKISFTINDDFLVPLIYKGDDVIFEECVKPQNGDIVVIRYIKDNTGLIRMWRQSDKQGMLSEINLEKIGEPYFFEIEKEENNNFFIKRKGKKIFFVIEGKLVLINKKINTFKPYLGIPCTFS